MEKAEWFPSQLRQCGLRLHPRKRWPSSPQCEQIIKLRSLGHLGVECAREKQRLHWETSKESDLFISPEGIEAYGSNSPFLRMESACSGLLSRSFIHLAGSAGTKTESISTLLWYSSFCFTSSISPLSTLVHWELWM